MCEILILSILSAGCMSKKVYKVSGKNEEGTQEGKVLNTSYRQSILE